ncbi:hypothetical protein VULLAG_LOCUS21309 [Vulpes lagopus]
MRPDTLARGKEPTAPSILPTAPRVLPPAEKRSLARPGASGIRSSGPGGGLLALPLSFLRMRDSELAQEVRSLCQAWDGRFQPRSTEPGSRVKKEPDRT